MLTFFFSNFVPQIAVFTVSLVGLVVVILKWKQGSRGSIWALLGFGIAFALTLLVPLGSTIAQQAVTNGSFTNAQRASIYSVLANAWGLLRAVSYVFLLVAVFAGRPPADASRPSA